VSALPSFKIILSHIVHFEIPAEQPEKIGWHPQDAALISLDKTKVHVAGNVSPLCDHEGSITGVIAILFPVAEINFLKYRGKAQF
jgi:hypothetical protein